MTLSEFHMYSLWSHDIRKCAPGQSFDQVKWSKECYFPLSLKKIPDRKHRKSRGVSIRIRVPSRIHPTTIATLGVSDPFNPFAFHERPLPRPIQEYDALGKKITPLHIRLSGTGDMFRSLTDHPIESSPIIAALFPKKHQPEQFMGVGVATVKRDGGKYGKVTIRISISPAV
jgi:hypothetical protein